MDNKIKELEKIIGNEKIKLLDKINHALANNNYEQYNYLKSLELQCDAELRLLKHLKSDDDNSKFIVC